MNSANVNDSSDAPDAADLRDAVGGDFRPGVAGPAKGHVKRTVTERFQLLAGNGGTLHRPDSRPAAKFRVCSKATFVRKVKTAQTSSFQEHLPGGDVLQLRLPP